jgi:hypothetical protein
LLQQYPPSLTQVLKLDPSLLSDDSYLAPYPALAQFIEDYPEVVRSPAFFIGPTEDVSEGAISRQRVYAVERIFGSFFLLMGFLTFFGLIGWVARLLVNHRRWLRASKVQMDTHNKLLDRLTSNEELLAYIQSEPGRRFLEAAPMAVEAPQTIAAPVGRILWSIQAGTVVALFGFGVLLLSRRTASDTNIADASPFLFMIGIVGLAIGVGFLLSALLAYLVSQRMGLLDTKSSHA